LLFAIYLLKEIDKEGHQYSLLLAAASGDMVSFEINHRFLLLLLFPSSRGWEQKTLYIQLRVWDPSL
jgi:hypothetical protein